MEILMEYLGKGFINMLMLSMPSVLVAAGIGLIVGILQAVTQVQEQTIAAAPKILGVFLVIMLLGNLSMNVLMNYVYEGANLAFNIVPKQDDFVLEADENTGKYNFFDAEKRFNSMQSQPDVNKLMKTPGKTDFGKTSSKLKVEKTNPGNASANFIEKQKIFGR